MISRRKSAQKKSPPFPRAKETHVNVIAFAVARSPLRAKSRIISIPCGLGKACRVFYGGKKGSPWEKQRRSHFLGRNKHPSLRTHKQTKKRGEKKAEKRASNSPLHRAHESKGRRHHEQRRGERRPRGRGTTKGERTRDSFYFSRVSMRPSRDSGLFWRARPSRGRVRRRVRVSRVL